MAGTSDRESALAGRPAVAGWLDRRLHLADLVELAKKKEVPQHRHQIWYYFGGISLYLFLVQVVSGILLLVYYSPAEEGAHASVLDIISKVDFGWLVRSVHIWAAHLMVLAVFIHLFSVFFMKAYRRPRELTWLTGMVLLLLVLGFGFSGYLLPWDELAYFATQVGLGITESVPLLGNLLADLLRGGPNVNGLTLQRFFALHVVVFPLLFLGVLAVHLFLIQLHGNTAPPGYYRLPPTERRTVPFFPNFFYNDLLVWLICLNLLSFLAALYPWEVGPQADTLAPAPAGIRPEWYFMPLYALLKLMPGQVGPMPGEQVGLVLFTVGGLLLALMPFWDRDTETGHRGRLATYYGFFVLVATIALTILGYWN